jgi:hypothetical protein
MKTKYMLLSRHQNVGENRDIKIANKSFENVSQFKYLRTTVTNQNLIQEEIKRFGQKRDEVTAGGENCITRSFVICTLSQV